MLREFLYCKFYVSKNSEIVVKLLYITNGVNGSGGLERVLSIKASYLGEHYEYDVSILVLNNADHEPFYEFSPKIKFYSIDVEGNLIRYLKSYKNGVQRVVDDIQPDFISVCDDGLKGFFIPSLIKTTAKMVYERHASIHLNTDNSIKGRVIKLLMQRQVSQFDRFVVLTNSNIEEWKGNNVIAIPNPVSFENNSTNSLQNKRIIAVGSHSYNKGYDLLLESWKLIEAKYPDWELNIYGKFDSEQTFIKQKEELSLKKVFFYPPVKDIREKYLESSIMVLPSRSEGFGMVLVEAMVCGIPCVSYDCPSGPRDIITNGEDGFLVKMGDIQSFSDKMQRLIEDDKLRKEMGGVALESVKRFSVPAALERWNSLFKELNS